MEIEEEMIDGRVMLRPIPIVIETERSDTDVSMKRARCRTRR